MRKYTRIPSKLSIEEVLSKVDENTPKYKSEVFHGVEVNIGIPNLKVFKVKGVKCANYDHCGTIGHTFYLEKTPGNFSFSIYNDWHLNLYGTNKHGHEVMMTKDHIIPKSKGGPDHLDNYQPMCEACNHRKGDKIDQAYTPSEIHTAAELDMNDEKVLHCFNYCKIGMKEKYGLEIDENDYKVMVQIAANGRNMKMIHWLSQHKTVREIQFKEKTVWLIYNSGDRVINTVMTPSGYERYFRMTPHWAKDMEQAALAEYDRILDDAKKILAERGSKINAEQAKFFKTLEHSALMFFLCKNQPIKVNAYIWCKVQEKFMGGTRNAVSLKGSGKELTDFTFNV